MRNNQFGNTSRLGLVLLAGSLFPLTGCHVDAQKNNGDSKVNISLPFGGLSVKTNEDAVGAGVGLAVYPGATLIKKDDHDGSADVNMNFGSFHLGVKALDYRTSDDPAKVLAFYRKEMTRFGTVIQCRDNHPVGTPDTTQDGLTCAEDDHSHPQIHIDEDSGHEQLKAGSRRHQHIIAVSQKDGYTQIGMVALDLPGNFVNGDSNSQ